MTWFGAKRAQFKPGFRDVRWGDPPAPGMSFIKKDGDEALAMRGDDSLRIGEGRLASINYQFWRGKLHGVVLSIASGSVKPVLDAVQQVYGKPTQPNPMKPKYYWMSVGSGEEATQAMLDVDTVKSSGTLIIFSKVLMDRRKAEEGAATASNGAA
jgi:hypothetical protein